MSKALKVYFYLRNDAVKEEKWNLNQTKTTKGEISEKFDMFYQFSGKARVDVLCFWIWTLFLISQSDCFFVFVFYSEFLVVHLSVLPLICQQIPYTCFQSKPSQLFCDYLQSCLLYVIRCQVHASCSLVGLINCFISDRRLHTGSVTADCNLAESSSDMDAFWPEWQTAQRGESQTKTGVEENWKHKQEPRLDKTQM